MVENPRYVHTNLVARDWRALADFYQSVFGCEPVPPERDFAQALISKPEPVSPGRDCVEPTSDYPATALTDPPSRS